MSTHAPSIAIPERPERSRKSSVSIVEAWPLFWSVVFLAGSLYASSYYFADLADRARHPWHPWLRSSGYIGQSAGIATLLGFLFLWLYPLRKKLGPGVRIGSIPKWLDVHIAAGLTLPLLGAVHAGWRFGGIIGLGYWAMMIVVASGVAGRYLYRRVPRSRAGVELSVEQIAGEERRMIQELSVLLSLAPEQVRALLATSASARVPRGVLATFGHLIREDFRRRSVLRSLRKRVAAQGGNLAVLDGAKMKRLRVLARQQISMSQQLRALEQTQRVLGYWHVAHRPIAVTAFFAVAAHVVVVVLFGATWFH